MTVALIELSLEEAPARPATSGLPPAYVYRRLGLLLSVLLVLGLGGAAPPQELLWRHVAFIALRDADFSVGDGRLYAMDFTTEPPTIRAWSGRTGRALWQMPGPVSTDGPYSINARIPGLVLVNVRRATTVLDSRTGATLWSSPTQLTPLGTGTGLVIGERFRPGTEYDQESGEPGILYGTSSDVLHTEPAQSTSLRGVDLRTGRELWTTSVPGSISTSWSGEALVVFSSDRITVRSPSTGAVLRERRLTGDPGQVWAETVGQTVLLHHGAYGEDEKIVAYALSTLAEIWQQDQPESEGSSFGCTGLPCLRSRDDLAVLDPDTGAVLWRTDGTVDLEAFGPDAVLQTRSAVDPLAVTDRRTGLARVGLDPWTVSTPLPDDRGLLVTKLEPGDGLVLGVLRPGATEVQLLGRAPGATVPCRPDTTFVVCQGDSGIDLYHYLG